MTMPHPQAKLLVDAGNTLLGRLPSTLDTGSIETPDGVLGVLTIRTPTTTLTLFLDAGELTDWKEVLGGLAEQLGGSGPGLARATPQDLSLLTQLARNGRRKG